MLSPLLAHSHLAAATSRRGQPVFSVPTHPLNTMSNPLDRLLRVLNGLDISESQRAEAVQHARALGKEVDKQAFATKRLQQDKDLVAKILTAQTAEIEEKNELLESQKRLLVASGQELEQRLLELRRSYESLEQFSYIASHDLKTPLRSISGYAQLLKRRYRERLDGEGLEFIQFIVDGVLQMDEIICNVLEYSNAITKREEKKMTDFAQIIEAAQQSLRDEIERTRAEIRLATPMPVMLAHGHSLGQLFQNLIGNAIKFRGDAPPTIEIAAEQQAHQWHFTIADNGLGVEEAYGHKIFQPFRRLLTDRPGRGMGLAICKKIVEMHRGEIWHQPRPDGGSVFHFTIASDEE